MPPRIDSDSTIETVWPHLSHQRAYVAGVLDKMRKCAKEHGNAFVKIGVTGTGQKPYYRVFYKINEEKKEIWGSFYDNHEPLENGFVETNNWSSASMSYQAVSDFLADKIGYKKKPL